MSFTTLGEMQEGDFYRMPWRAPTALEVGRIESIGSGSVQVYQPRHEGEGWETTTVARGTQVVPATEEEFHRQMSDEGSPAGRNRSTVEKPVDIVWRVCNEMGPVATRDEIVTQCVEQGVNINTARTQYYKWRKTIN